MAEDEDTFTGHVGALLGCAERQTDVSGQTWRWRIEYSKFRGRGRDASETFLGADGIFEVRVTGPEVDGRKSSCSRRKWKLFSGHTRCSRLSHFRIGEKPQSFLYISNEPLTCIQLTRRCEHRSREACRGECHFQTFSSGRFWGAKWGIPTWSTNPEAES